MSRYTIKPQGEHFVIIDTTNNNKVHSTYPDAAAAGAQVAHLNSHPGMKVGAPITPDTKPWNPIEKP
jgi:hypothetical protein